MIRLLLLLILPLFLTANVFAQSVVGNWKRTSMTLTDASGKQQDMVAMMTKAMPCSARITYTFLANGTMRVNVPDDCGSLKATIEKINQPGRWSATGNQIKIVVLDKSLPDAIYDLRVAGNTMTWDFDYGSNPQMPNPTKAKHTVITYQRQ